MESTTLKIDNGDAETICRGFRASFLDGEQYASLSHTSSLQDFKTTLEETDYAKYLQFESQTINVAMIRQRLRRKLADEFEYLAAQSVYPLTEFLRIISCRFMIDNVVNMIEGIKNKVDPDSLLSNADPLGYFPEMKNIKDVDADDYNTLYSKVLINTPVGPYFKKFLDDVVADGSENVSLMEIQTLFKDLKPEQIRTSLKKVWLENFYKFCIDNLNPLSAKTMADLLQFEADFQTIQVVYNSIGHKDFSSAESRVTLRKRLCPTIGLYPDCEKDLLNAETLYDLRQAVSDNDIYFDILRYVSDPMRREEFSTNTETLDDYMHKEEVKRYSTAFEEQGHYGVFYAYLKLKEQEIRNIDYMGCLVIRGMGYLYSRLGRILIPFKEQFIN